MCTLSCSDANHRVVKVILHTSVLATIAKRTRAAPSPFSPLAPHRATATAENSSEIAPEMGKKGRDTGKVDNGLKERLRANMKAKKKGTPCYAFGMALNPKMKSVLGVEHRALLVVKSGDPDIDLYIRSLFATGGCGQYSKDSVEDGEDYIMKMAALKKVVPPLRP